MFKSGVKSHRIADDEILPGIRRARAQQEGPAKVGLAFVLFYFPARNHSYHINDVAHRRHDLGIEGLDGGFCCLLRLVEFGDACFCLVW